MTERYFVASKVERLEDLGNGRFRITYRGKEETSFNVDVPATEFKIAISTVAAMFIGKAAMVHEFVASILN